jgi:GT2 family glycosyltransferase
MMARREVIDAIGPFDQQFFVWFADWDVCSRAAAAGWSVYYVEGARAIHHERQSFSPKQAVPEEIQYKTDGWHSSVPQILDRTRFLKKHRNSASTTGSRLVYLLEHGLRFCLILGGLGCGKLNRNKASFQLKTCLNSIRTVLTA